VSDATFELPAALRERQPSIDAAGAANLRRMVEHPDAPRWNHVAGDRLDAADLEWLRALRERLRTPWPAPEQRATSAPSTPSASVLAWLAGRATQSPHLRAALRGRDAEHEFATLPTMSREDLALRIGEVVPDDAPLDEMLVYSTAGTTGHPLRVPQHRRGVAAYLALVEHALARWGVTLELGPDRVGAVLLGAQRETVTYPCVLSGWDQAGFAKLNLDAAGWPDADAPRRYLDDLAPELLTSDPLSLSAFAQLGCRHRPKAALSTAVAMSPALRERLRERIGAPVIDWYSLTETGPIAYLCPAAGAGEPEAMHLLSTDLYVEAVDADGRPVADGERGEITVTGGRNPFVPLLRYRTGDWGALLRRPCRCGDPAPRLVELLGRAPVLFRATDGAIVNPVDVSRQLRPYPLVAHELEQAADGRCSLRYRAFAGEELADDLRRALEGLLGERPGGAAIDVLHDPTLATRPGKILPYRSALTLESLLA
jgi:phenylacetate-CoA ligase